MPILSVKRLNKAFTVKKNFWATPQTFTAVRDISFDLHEGEILGLLGVNGAGKTTTIQMLLGTLTATSGSIFYFGKDFFKHNAEIMQHVACAGGYDRLPGRLTVWQNLDVFGRIYGLSGPDREARIDKMLQSFDMVNMRDRRTATLSAGQATRLLLAKAFLSRPKVVLLDEPTASLDPTMAAQVREFVLKQKHEYGTAILFSSHNMEEVTQVCDRALVMKNGEIVADNTPDKLAATIKVAHVHLFVPTGPEPLLQFLKEQHIKHDLHEHWVDIEIEERHIAAFLSALGQRDIAYTSISIDKSSLEDYFLSIS